MAPTVAGLALLLPEGAAPGEGSLLGSAVVEAVGRTGEREREAGLLGTRVIVGGIVPDDDALVIIISDTMVVLDAGVMDTEGKTLDAKAERSAALTTPAQMGSFYIIEHIIGPSASRSFRDEKKHTRWF